jgi:carbon monoxide dehydrogenase subunit G
VKTETARIDIDASPDAVWAVVGDFGGLDSWMAGVDACDVEGDVRTVHTMGMQIKEKLVARDDATRSITYSITEGAPAESHEATITVADGADGGSHVTWDVSVAPDEMAELFGGIYQGALDALKGHIEG